MKTIKTLKSLLLGMALVSPLAQAEILAMLNYESKPNVTPRREGIAIIDVDPGSKNFSKIITDIPLPPDLVGHHIFYNKDASKAYFTSLGSNPLQVMDMKKYPYRLKTIAVPDCQVGEDVAFSKDNKTWYLTCMGSSNVMVGDAQTDKAVKTIAASETKSASTFISYPHGIGLQDDIDRIVVTSTVRPSDLGAPGETVTVIEASSGKVLSTHKLSDKPSPSGVSPVEAVFLPGANPATVYVNNMFGGTMWAGVWDQDSKELKFREIYDFNPIKQGVPLEIYFNHDHNRMFVTTANPGALNVFDISQPTQPKLLKSIPTAGGAHHVVFSPDEHYAFVQNSFLNLPKMDDGSISVIDLVKMEKTASIDTLKEQGFNPNCIVMLPEWHHDDAH
ncbi:MAG: YncE family protein [Methylovulum sp.]|uniref:YncE family protein n=1 Tax=Methylovulum sp. TaxID=1916980 RepID=UPI00262DE851|nr:YncE family protein [Methylovulum sp.]MDD2725445.1 YncE family protein [Methylovulum sp.]MDD5124482.1 YncE family protein [Methylovulum sp.]